MRVSEETVLRILRKNGGWMIVGELISETGASRRGINIILKILLDKGDVLMKVIYTRKGAKHVWKAKL